MTVIVSMLRRGGGGTSPFPASQQQDLRLPHVSVADIAERDLIPEWKRLAKMTCFIIADDVTYRLGIDVTISGQVWTPESASGAFQITSEKNQPSGYVGLTSEGIIDPQYIKSIYVQDFFFVDDDAGRFAQPSVTGDIVHQLDNNQVYIKKNNNVPTTVEADWADITAASAVSSVNGDVGAISIDIVGLLAWANNQAEFEAAVEATPSVSANQGQISTNTSEISNLYDAINAIIADTTATIPLWDVGVAHLIGNNVVYDTGSGRKNLYRCILAAPAGTVPTNATYWEKIGDCFTQNEITNLLSTKANLVAGKVPVSELPAEALGTSIPEVNIWYVNKGGNDTTGDGSPQTPFLTVNKAYSMAASFDTIHLAPGLYSETVIVARPTIFSGFTSAEFSDGLTSAQITKIQFTAGNTFNMIERIQVNSLSFDVPTGICYLQLYDAYVYAMENISAAGHISVTSNDVRFTNFKTHAVAGDESWSIYGGAIHSYVGGQSSPAGTVTLNYTAVTTLEPNDDVVVLNNLVVQTLEEFTGSVTLNKSQVVTDNNVAGVITDNNPWGTGTGSTPTYADKKFVSEVTTTDGEWSGAEFTGSPIGYTGSDVDGIHKIVGDAVKTEECYWSRDGGTTALALSALAIGDRMYWNGSEAGFELDGVSIITLNYNIQ